VELIIASVMALSIPGTLVVIVISHLRSTNRTTIHLQPRRGCRDLSVMSTEASEGFSLQIAANPASCKQICATTSSSDLRLLTPVVSEAVVA